MSQEMTLRFSDELRRFYKRNHDQCSNCNYPFKEGDTSHLGYGTGGEFLCVGDCCSKKISETVVRHYFQPRPYTVPEDSSILWRFMDFVKFISLLSTSSLYFCRIDQFKDPFEGAKGIYENKEKWDKHYLNFFKEAILNPPEEYVNAQPLKEAEVESQARELLDDIEMLGKRSLKEIFVNCWYENKWESEAMWNLSLQNSTQSVAISTSYGKLCASLNDYLDIEIGRVNYIDFDTHYSGINSSHFYKRKSLEHEKEVRAVIRCHDAKKIKGKLIKINLNELIQDIYVSPQSPKWFQNLVIDILKRYKLDRSVKRSRIERKPFF